MSNIGYRGNVKLSLQFPDGTKKTIYKHNKLEVGLTKFFSYAITNSDAYTKYLPAALDLRYNGASLLLNTCNLTGRHAEKNSDGNYVAIFTGTIYADNLISLPSIEGSTLCIVNNDGEALVSMPFPLISSINTDNVGTLRDGYAIVVEWVMLLVNVEGE